MGKVTRHDERVLLLDGCVPAKISEKLPSPPRSVTITAFFCESISRRLSSERKRWSGSRQTWCDGFPLLMQQSVPRKRATRKKKSPRLRMSQPFPPQNRGSVGQRQESCGVVSQASVNVQLPGFSQRLA